MTNTISSLTELTRVGGWALRGLGYPFGTAERATRLLAWTEAVDGTAIRSLEKLETTIGLSLQADAVELQSTDCDAHLDAKGRHLLEMGPPAVDLATSNARRHGIGHVDVSNIHGLNFVPAMANLLAHRRLDALFIYRTGLLDVMPAQIPETGWILASGSGNQSTFRRGDLTDNPEQIVRAIFGAAGRSDGADIASRIAGNLVNAEKGGSAGYMSVTAIKPSTDRHADLAAMLGDLGREENFSERLAAALTHGFSIAMRDLQYLYQLEMRTWAPTSERSRGQAGYGVY